MAKTMQQVADELGVSRLVVSAVVNGRAAKCGISAATAERVAVHLQQCGFVPSLQAQELRSRPARRLGLLHTGRLYSHLIEAFNRFIEGYADTPETLVISAVRQGHRFEAVRELVGRGITDLIWLRTDEGGFIGDPALGLLQAVRTVIYNYPFHAQDESRALARRRVHLIGVDRTAGWRELGRMLHAYGHRRVFLGDERLGSMDPYERAKTLTDSGLQVRLHPDPLPCDGGLPPIDMEARAAAVVARAVVLWRDEKVTAICLGDDELAAHVTVAIIERGLAVPDDLTVTGFDGHPFGPLLRVPLTSLAFPVEAMVARTMQLVAGKRIAAKPLVLPLTLTLRGSHAPCRQTLNTPNPR